MSRVANAGPASSHPSPPESPVRTSATVTDENVRVVGVAPLPATSLPASTGSIPAAVPGYIEIKRKVSFSVMLSSFGYKYDFRAHPDVQKYLADAAFVDLVYVKANVSQKVTFGFVGTTSSLTTRRFAVGLAPGSSAPSTGDGDSAVGTGRTAFYLEEFLTQALVANTMIQEYSNVPEYSGEPFPPGLQTDLRSIQVKNGYVNYAAFNCTRVASSSTKLLHVTLRFIVRVSGQGWGVGAGSL